MKLPLALATVLTALSFFFVSAITTGAEPKVPEYPKQPYINTALKQLGEAREKAPANPTEALAHLNKASIALDRRMDGKGSFANTAKRLTDQAIKHLEKGEADTAMKEINDAIEATHKAGKMGAR